MVTVGISEFSFGYAFLYEQTRARWADVRAAPILPSLRQERDRAYDAQLPLNGTDFYYQFKISDYLKRGNAKHISDGTYDGPYYRFALYRKDGSRQHRRLFAHALANPNTFYVAPELNDMEDFNAAFLAGQITENCRLIPVRDTADIDDDEQHYITFRDGRADWDQHSKRHRGETSWHGGNLRRLYQETSNQWRPIDQAFAIECFRKVKDVASQILEREERITLRAAFPLFDFNPGEARLSEILLRTSQVVSIFLGATLVIVGDRETEASGRSGQTGRRG